MGVIVHPALATGSISDRFLTSIKCFVFSYQDEFIIKKETIDPINFAVSSIIGIKPFGVGSFISLHWNAS